MYYEYYLEDGSVYNSNTANLSEVKIVVDDYCECCGTPLRGVTVTKNVRYCIIREGILCDLCKKEDLYCTCEPFDDYEYWHV